MTKRIENTLKIVHCTVQLRVSESTYNWDDPSVQTDIDFSMPVELADVASIAKLIKSQLAETVTAFNCEKIADEEAKAKAAFEKDQAEKADHGTLVVEIN